MSRHNNRTTISGIPVRDRSAVQRALALSEADNERRVIGLLADDEGEFPTIILESALSTTVGMRAIWVVNGDGDIAGYPDVVAKIRIASDRFGSFFDQATGVYKIDPRMVPGYQKPDHGEGKEKASLPARTPRISCFRGHLWTPENTLVVKRGHRECRTCRNAREAKRDREARSGGQCSGKLAAD